MKTYSSPAYSRYHGYYKKRFYRTRRFYFFLLLIVIAAGFVYWSINRADNEMSGGQKFTDQTDIPITSAKITLATGKLETKAPGDSWQEVGENYQVQVDETVRTSAEGRAIIELPDKSFIRLAENSELKIVQMGMADVVIEQLSGTAFHHVNDSSTAIYRVKNGSTELTALGTAFNVLTSSQLTYLTVTENRVKVKIYNGEDIVNMRTIEQGSKATVNPTLELEKMIQTEETSIGELLEKDWYVWNLDQDRAAGLYLGLFDKALKLTIIEPSETEITTDQDKIKIKGETEPEAEIFMVGKEIENNDGKFETELALAAGKNEIEVTVKKGKNQNKKVLIINSTKQKQDIVLNGAASGGQVELAWEAKNLDNIQEFKILQGSGESPTYPNAPYHSVGNKVFTDKWEKLTNGKYYFRVCALTKENKCQTYSNDLPIEISVAALPAGSLSLSVSADRDNAKLAWSVSKELKVAEGFKTVIAQTENPGYPGNSYHSLQNNERNDTWKKLNPGNYHFRVCLLKNNQCLIYSNDAALQINDYPDETIVLSGSAHPGALNLTWAINNLEITKGFKVVMDEKPGVVFPGRDHHFITSSTAASDAWVNLEQGKTYYFRVCQNLGSVCGVCSNEISLIFE